MLVLGALLKRRPGVVALLVPAAAVGQIVEDIRQPALKGYCAEDLPTAAIKYCEQTLPTVGRW